LIVGVGQREGGFVRAAVLAPEAGDLLVGAGELQAARRSRGGGAWSRIPARQRREIGDERLHGRRSSR